MSHSRADATRSAMIATLDKFRQDPDRPANESIWSPQLDSASRDQLTAIQTEKLRAAVPFLYENSPFYRRRFDRLGLLPSDIGHLGDLTKWPVVDKSEMMADALEHPPYGTYSTMTDEVWAKRGCFAIRTSTAKPGRGPTRGRYWRWAFAKARRFS
jgi:phenylacetate-CoA ligase